MLNSCWHHKLISPLSDPSACVVQICYIVKYVEIARTDILVQSWIVRHRQSSSHPITITAALKTLKFSTINETSQSACIHVSQNGPCCSDSDTVPLTVLDWTWPSARVTWTSTPPPGFCFHCLPLQSKVSLSLHHSLYIPSYSLSILLPIQIKQQQL